MKNTSSLFGSEKASSWKFLSLFIGLLGILNLISCGQKNTVQSTIPGLDPNNLHGVEILTHEDSINAPAFSKEPQVYNFGTIEQGQVVDHVFHFRNVGHSPLILKKIQPSCSCTTVDFTHEPIAVNDTGSFHIKFDSKGKFGPQRKIITIFANTIPRVQQVALSGFVNIKSK